MALKYYADLATGEAVEFSASRVDNRNGSPKNTDSWGFHGGEWVKITRVVSRKSGPSMHECDSRCMNASGRTMQCECACGGKNHGRGRFVCEAT